MWLIELSDSNKSHDRIEDNNIEQSTQHDILFVQTTGSIHIVQSRMCATNVNVSNVGLFCNLLYNVKTVLARMHQLRLFIDNPAVFCVTCAGHPLGGLCVQSCLLKSNENWLVVQIRKYELVDRYACEFVLLYIDFLLQQSVQFWSKLIIIIRNLRMG